MTIERKRIVFAEDDETIARVTNRTIFDPLQDNHDISVDRTADVEGFVRALESIKNARQNIQSDAKLDLLFTDRGIKGCEGFDLIAMLGTGVSRDHDLYPKNFECLIRKARFMAIPPEIYADTRIIMFSGDFQPLHKPDHPGAYFDDGREWGSDKIKERFTGLLSRLPESLKPRGIFEKPFNADELRKAVREALAFTVQAAPDET